MQSTAVHYSWFSLAPVPRPAARLVKFQTLTTQSHTRPLTELGLGYLGYPVRGAPTLQFLPAACCLPVFFPHASCETADRKATVHCLSSALSISAASLASPPRARVWPHFLTVLWSYYQNNGALIDYTNTTANWYTEGNMGMLLPANPSGRQLPLRGSHHAKVGLVTESTGAQQRDAPVPGQQKVIGLCSCHKQKQLVLQSRVSGEEHWKWFFTVTWVGMWWTLVCVCRRTCVQEQMNAPMELRREKD